MLKKIVFRLLIISLTTWALSGCGGGGGGGNTTPNNGPIQNEIEQVITEFKEAVEAYDVDGMLAPLDESNFELTIKEGNLSPYPKDYETLKKELEDDEQNQLAWRKSPEEDGDGHSYRLELELSNYKFANLTTTGGYVTCDFTVWESHSNQTRIPTDNGTITLGMVKKVGEWKMQTMLIEFKTVIASSLQISNYQFSNERQGFMFGKLTW